MSGAALGAAAAEERKKLHRLGDDLGVATLVLAEGRSLEVAATPGQRSAYPVHSWPRPTGSDQSHGRPAEFDGRGR